MRSPCAAGSTLDGHDAASPGGSPALSDVGTGRSGGKITLNAFGALCNEIHKSLGHGQERTQGSRFKCRSDGTLTAGISHTAELLEAPLG